MDERRKAQRYPMELHGNCVGDNGDTGKHCKVIEISRDGMAIQLFSKERISTGRELVLEIDITTKRDPVKAVITLKWIKEIDDETGYSYLAGGELTTIEKSDKQALLEYGYENWKKHQEET